VGVDIALNICAEPFTLDAIWDCISLKRGIVYLVSDSPRPLSGNRPFFGLWASAPHCLTEICKRLSFKVERVYTCWKCEHGGVAGYRIYNNGLESAERDGSLEPMLLDGFRECFGESLSIGEDKTLSFPELLLGEPLECWLFDFQSGTRSLQRNSVIKQLLEGDIGAEPVLLFEI
jgi:hypothetical protein